MTKSLSNKLFMKKQLYNYRMKEGIPILQYLNTFNRIMSDFIGFKGKARRRQNSYVTLLSSIEFVTPRSHGNRDVTVMYIRMKKIPSNIYVKHQ